MRKPVVNTLLLVVVLLICTGARRPAPMYMPLPTAIPGGVSSSDAVKAVKQTLMGRGWVVTEERESTSEHTLVGQLAIRVHVVIIQIRISNELIAIEYVSSKEMRYKKVKGQSHIHPKYTQWIKNIETDLRARLAALEP